MACASWQARLVAQIHDELMFEVDARLSLPAVVALVRGIMEGASCDT